MKISACVIAKNEEKNIDLYFAKIQSLVQEIIFVDTGSTDRTVEMARSHGAKIYMYEWKQDFAAAKNYALQQATGDWIVFLDVDEYFSSESIENLKHYLKKIHDNKSCDAVGVRIINIDVDKDNQELSSFINVRVFRNQANLRYKNAIHEELCKVRGTVNIFMLENDIKVYHTGYSSSIVREKLKRNLEIIRKEIDHDGEQLKHYRYLCDCYHGLSDYENAIKYGRLHIESSLSSLGSESIVYEKVIDSLMKSDAPAAEIKLEITKAIQTFPDNPDFYGAYGRFAWTKKNYEVALQYFLQAISLYDKEAKDVCEASSFGGNLTAVYFILGEIYFLKNQSDKAIECYLESLMRYKYNKGAFQRVYRLLMEVDPLEVISAFNKVYERTHKDIKFLVDNLQECPKNKVFVYYSNILTKDFNDTVECVWQYQMMGLKNYQKLFAKNTEVMIQNTNLLAAASIAQNNQLLLGAKLDILNKDYQNIVKCFYDHSLQLNDNLFVAYRAVLYELLLINSAALDHYLEIAGDFSSGNILIIAKTLIDYKQYHRALNLYQQGSRMLLMTNILAYYEGMGYCSYKLGLYSEAANYFDKVLEKNPDNQRILQFKNWSEARC